MEVGHLAPCKVSLSGLYSTESIKIQRNQLLEFDVARVNKLPLVSIILKYSNITNVVPALSKANFLDCKHLCSCRRDDLASYIIRCSLVQNKKFKKLKIN